MTMVISGSDGVTFPDSTNQYSGGAFSFKNRVINGDMRIDQRNAGAAVTATGSYPVDRFLIQIDTDGAFSSQQDSSAPTGFIKSTKITTTTADGTLSASQYFQIQQRIEGTNISDLAWGSASAKTITLSFWIRSSLTGTFGGALTNGSFNRSYPFTYSVSSADTWEYKTITIAGDTSGTWNTNTDAGIIVRWGLGVGSNYSGTAGAWTGSGLMSATGATSLIGTLNATFYITGVQLEVGSVATPFERRPYGTELALCQRYYSEVGRQLVGRTESSTVATMVCSTTVKMRTAPTLTLINGTNALAVPGVAAYTISSIAANSSADNAIYVSFYSTGLSNPTVTVGNIDRVLGVSAEL